MSKNLIFLKDKADGKLLAVLAFLASLRVAPSYSQPRVWARLFDKAMQKAYKKGGMPRTKVNARSR